MWSGKIKSDLYILDQIVLQLKLISIPVIAIVTLEASNVFRIYHLTAQYLDTKM